jgi:hypothetical protein
MNAHFLRELDWVFAIRHRVEFEPDNRESVRAIAIQKFLIAGHLFLTGLTPSCPEIDEHHFPAQVSRGNLMPLKVLYSEVWQPGAKITGSDRVCLRLCQARGLLMASDEPKSNEAKE